MSSLIHKPTIEGSTAQVRRGATANPAFKPEFARSLRMHPVLAGTVAALVLLALVLFAMRQGTMYSAESLIYIEPMSSKLLSDGTGGGFDSTRYESLLAQQMLTAQRSDIVATALQGLPHQVWADYGPTPEAAAAVLQAQLKVVRVTTSYQVSISLKGPNPANTAAIVNAVTSTYLAAGRKDEISQADQRSQLLSEERARIEQELVKDRAEQVRLGATLGVANPGNESTNPYDLQLDALRSQLVAARASHDQAAAQLAAISGSGGNHASGLTAAANEAIASDSGLGSMKATINARRAQLATQMAGLTPTNPVYSQYQDELADLDKTLNTMTTQMRDRAARSLQDKLRTELERSSDVEARMNAELARQTASATSASPRLQRAAELAADLQRLNLRYTTVDNALHSLQLETTGPGMAHLALAAAVPTSPEPTRKRLILLAAVPLALLSGLAAAVFARKRDKRIYTSADVDEVLGFAPIALLPSRAETADDVLDEYYLRLAAGVEGAYRANNARTFVVTAVSASTDTLPLVQALDRKLIELGLGVAIVEAAEVFEPQAPGAAHHEIAQITLDRSPDRHHEGLAAALFARLKIEHDLILLQAPALLVSAQTEYVSRCADVTLLIAESAVTTRGELFQAGSLLQRLAVTGVGSVLSEVQLRHADAGFRKGLQSLEGRTLRSARTRPVVSVESQEARSPVAGERAERGQESKAADPAPEDDFDSSAATGMSSGAAFRPADSDQVDERNASFAEPQPDHFDSLERSIPPGQALPDSGVIVPSSTGPDAGPGVHLTAFEGPAVAPSVASIAPAISPVSVPAPDPLIEESRPVIRQQATGLEAEPQESRGWFKRIFQRDAQPIMSIVPDDDDEETEGAEATPAETRTSRQFDASQYDIAPAKADAEKTVSETPEPASTSMTPASVDLSTSVVVPEVLLRAPEPVSEDKHAESNSIPVSSVEEEAATSQSSEALPSPAVAIPAPWTAPAAADPAALEGLPYAFQPRAVAVVVAAAPVVHTAPAVLSAPVAATSDAPVAQEHARPASSPSRPLSFLELKERREGTVEPQQIASVDRSLARTVEAVVEEPVPVPLEDWTPAPLNRWDPIPPLRNAEEPWRISRTGIRAAAPAGNTDRGELWGAEDPVRIPPSDRWGRSEPLQDEPTPDSALESNEIVLTRRWGLLSRFQQGESFQSARREAANGNRALSPLSQESGLPAEDDQTRVAQLDQRRS